MTGRRAAAVVALAALVAAGGCSDDGDDDAASTSTTATTTTTERPSTTEAPSTTSDATSTTTAPAEVGDPLDAAEAWLDLVFPANTATVGELQQGDARSGEVPVFRSREDGTLGPPASTLLLRLDADDEWQVLGAVSDVVTIEEPTEQLTSGATVSGVGRGFEGAIVVRAVAADGTELGVAVAQGGAQAEPAPYATTLDLTGAAPGSSAYLVVNGGVGLEGDTGEFAALRLPIGD